MRREKEKKDSTKTESERGEERLATRELLFFLLPLPPAIYFRPLPPPRFECFLAFISGEYKYNLHLSLHKGSQKRGERKEKKRRPIFFFTRPPSGAAPRSGPQRRRCRFSSSRPLSGPFSPAPGGPGPPRSPPNGTSSLREKKWRSKKKKKKKQRKRILRCRATAPPRARRSFARVGCSFLSLLVPLLLLPLLLPRCSTPPPERTAAGTRPTPRPPPRRRAAPRRRRGLWLRGASLPTKATPSGRRRPRSFLRFLLLFLTTTTRTTTTLPLPPPKEPTTPTTAPSAATPPPGISL